MAAGLGVGGCLLVGVAQRLVIGVPEQRRIVEGDFRVEADELLLGATGTTAADDRERVDLDEIGVVGQHRPDQTLRDPDGSLEVRPEPEPERELTGLPVPQPEHGVRVDPNDRSGVVGGHLLDLDAALGGAISRIFRAARSRTAAR